MLEWLPFGASACGVIGAGILIGQISGEIGERLRLGRAWAGAVLLSLATTLPELVATVTSRRLDRRTPPAILGLNPNLTRSGIRIQEKNAETHAEIFAIEFLDRIGKEFQTREMTPRRNVWINVKQRRACHTDEIQIDAPPVAL